MGSASDIQIKEIIHQRSVPDYQQIYQQITKKNTAFAPQEGVPWGPGDGTETLHPGSSGLALRNSLVGHAELPSTVQM